MEFSANDKKVLIDLAHRSVRGFIEKGIKDDFDMETGSFPSSLTAKKGVFVAIYHGSSLRGCMGTLLPVLSIWRSCAENARNAAYKDPRFLPVHSNELSNLSFEVTILGVPRPLSDISQLEKGTCGLILTKGFRKEVFLPGALKDLPHSIEEIFAMLRAKVDISEDDHNAPEQWELFDAEVISDRDTDDGI